MKTQSGLQRPDAAQDEQFRALFTRYSNYVYTIIWNRIRTVGTHEDAEEAVSDVFAELFRNADRIEAGKTESYLRTLAKRRAVDAFRQLSARRRGLTDGEDALEAAVSDEDIAGDHERAELRRRLLACIRSLGEPDATIVICKYFYDCKACEIGEKVGMNEIAVRTRLSRARAKLRKLLAGEDITL